jgi:peptide deformylase
VAEEQVQEQIEGEVDGEVETGPSAEERRAHHDAARRLVRQYPDAALRIPANPVVEIDGEVQRLAERMVAIMRDSHGVGLAAPQIGVLRRVLVYRRRDEDTPVILINPELSEMSEETETDTEGCLSLLGGDLLVPVERSLRLVATGVGADGEHIRIEAEGMEARILQHEIDHLDGVLIIDRATKDDRRAALRELRLS